LCGTSESESKSEFDGFEVQNLSDRASDRIWILNGSITSLMRRAYSLWNICATYLQRCCSGTSEGRRSRGTSCPRFIRKTANKTSEVEKKTTYKITEDTA